MSKFIRSLIFLSVFSFTLFSQTHASATPIQKAAVVLGDVFSGHGVVKVECSSAGSCLNYLNQHWKGYGRYLWNLDEINNYADGDKVGSLSMKGAYDFFMDGGTIFVDALSGQQQLQIKTAFNSLVGSGVIFVFNEKSVTEYGSTFTEVGLLDMKNQVLYMIYTYPITANRW